MHEIKILTPIGMLGYGFSREEYERALDMGIDAVIMDGGSTDPGPYLLGLNQTIVKPASIRRDLQVTIDSMTRKGLRIPVLISSAGGAGTKEQVDLVCSMIHEICADEGIERKVVRIYADIDKDLVLQKFREGKIHSCSSAPEAAEQDITDSVRIVAQMGYEPILKALREHPDADFFIIGRAYDPSPYVAFAHYKGIENEGICHHFGKIIECGAACAEPKSNMIVATVRDDSFDLCPLRADARCTPVSVAAHTLYEKTRPDRLPGPGGVLILDHAEYEQISDRVTRVSGSAFEKTPYQVKLEGASIVGYRCVFFAGIRDPFLIRVIEPLSKEVVRYVNKMVPGSAEHASIRFHYYGKNGVMGEYEPAHDRDPWEIGLLCEVTADTQEMANTACSIARVAILHGPYPGQMATAGNVALPLNPPDNPIGPVCRFTLYHTMDIDDPTAYFPIMEG